MTENEAKEWIKYLGNQNLPYDRSPKGRKLACDIAIQALQKVQQFEAIGTVEEFKALKEKSVAKKVVRQKGALNKYYHEEECPKCKAEFRVHVAGYKYTQAVGETHYCPNCGQKLDWQ